VKKFAEHTAMTNGESYQEENDKQNETEINRKNRLYEITK